MVEPEDFSLEELGIKEPKSGSGGSGGKVAKKKRFGTFQKRGRRDMKFYEVSEDELWNLFAFGLVAAFSFSIAGWFLGFAFDISKDLDLSEHIKPEKMVYWIMARNWSFTASAFFVIIAIISIIIGNYRIHKILTSTKFDEDE
jgi:hypothetical protein